MKFRYLIVIAILASLFLISCASAQCADSQRILRLSSATNAHAELYNYSNPLGNYSVQVCYNEIFRLNFTRANPQACQANDANLVLRLSTPTNAHAEIPSQNNYSIPVCYGDLACTRRAGSCAPNEMPTVSLVSTTNSHISNSSSYPSLICCSSAFQIQNAFCGDGAINQAGEQCDGADLAGQTCISQGGIGGVLSCYPSGSPNQCQFDLTQCTGAQPSCDNDNIREGTEQCDGTDLNSQSCTTLGLGFTGGTLSCSGTCLFNQSGCTNRGGGNGGNNGGNNKDNGGIVGLFRGDENPVTSFFAGEEEIETGKKLEAEESLLNKFFAFIQSDSLKLILLPLLLFIILMILLIALLAGRKRNLSVKNNNSVPSKS